MIKLSLIGMSGAGKVSLGAKAGGAGFRVIGIDDRIEKKLAPELAAGGYRGIGGVAAWMGWPDQPTYREREKKYLECEIESMSEALDEIEASGDEGIILDTTGSVVYTGEEICRRMQNLTTVVYLEAAPAEEELLIARYLSDPEARAVGRSICPAPGRIREGCRRALLSPADRAPEETLRTLRAPRRFDGASCEARNPDARGFLELLEGAGAARAMKFRSTLRRSPEVSLRDAVLRGSAPDGGLYMPVEIPHLPEDFLGRLPFAHISGNRAGSRRTVRRATKFLRTCS